MRKKKIKILHVAQAAGGVDRYIRMLLKYLDKEKFENILVCSQDFNREDYDGLVDSFEQIEMNRAIGVSDLNSIKEVRRLIKKYNPDIVYAHSSKAGAIARVADIGLKNHCVYNPHGWAFNMRCSDKKRAMYTAIEKMAAPFCEKIHLHGMYDERDGIDNIIADYIQYQTILRNSGAQFIQNLIGTNPIIIVGCGGTMEDPNLSGFMSFAYEKLGTSDIPYFYLMKSGDTIYYCE